MSGRVMVWTLAACVGLGTVQAHGGKILHVDDFQDGTLQGWTGAFAPAPTVIATGGPAGDGDRFLSFAADGGSGPGSRLAIYNSASDWIGSYADLGVTSVEVDMMNPATTPAAFAMRLVLFGPQSTNNRWTSKTAVSVPNDGVWRRVSFPINADDLTRVQGSSSFDSISNDVVRVMLRHDAQPPSAGGTAVVGSLGIDNVTLVGRDPADFNVDGVLDVQDLNLLLAQVRSGANEAAYDVNQDGRVDTADIQQYVESPEILNTYLGDANLDGEFNSSDMVVVFQAGQYEVELPTNSLWQTGDWNGDAKFNSGDMIFAFQGGGYELGPRTAVMAAVPEPNSALLLCLAFLGVAMRRARMARSA